MAGAMLASTPSAQPKHRGEKAPALARIRARASLPLGRRPSETGRRKPFLGAAYQDVLHPAFLVAAWARAATAAARGHGLRPLASMHLTWAHLEERSRPQTPPQCSQVAPGASSVALELQPPASRVRTFSANSETPDAQNQHAPFHHPRSPHPPQARRRPSLKHHTPSRAASRCLR